jgi:hypothetical protein
MKMLNIRYTSKKLGLIATVENKSIVSPKLKLTQFAKDEASKSAGILPQEHFPSSSVKKNGIDHHS